MAKRKSIILINISVPVLGEGPNSCADAYNVTSEWGTGQNGMISFIVPKVTSESNAKITFDKNIKGINVARYGKDENCIGKVCTFKFKSRNPVKKGQKLDLIHRIGLESEGHAQMIEFVFNEERIC